MLQFNKVVMVGLDPAIHADLGKGGAVLDMDARVERGHDGRMATPWGRAA